METRDTARPRTPHCPKIPIEEVVQEYSIAVDVVRSWIEERGIDVAFAEYSYFYRALFELTAEAVRRYSAEQANIVSGERARYRTREWRDRLKAERALWGPSDF